MLGHSDHLLGCIRGVVRWSRAPRGLKHLAELLAVLSQVNRSRAGTQDRYTRTLQVCCQRQRCLPTELDNHALHRTRRALCAVDFEDVLECEGLEIEAIGDVIVGRDRLRVAVNHDCLVVLT